MTTMHIIWAIESLMAVWLGALMWATAGLRRWRRVLAQQERALQRLQAELERRKR